MKMFFLSQTRGVNLDAIVHVEAHGPTLVVQFSGAEQLTLTGEEAEMLAEELRSTGEGANFAENHNFNRDGRPRRAPGQARSGFNDED